jgi:hypothetical protein
MKRVRMCFKMLEAEFVLRRVQNFVRRNLLWILAGLLFSWAVFLRYEHVLDHNYYYIVSPDSYFFHWLGGRLMAGEGPPLGTPTTSLPLYNLHSGLAPALAYVAKAAQVVFHMSPQVALDFASRLVSPVLGVAFFGTIFIIGYKMCGRRVGMFTAFAGASIIYGVLTFASGYADREGLSALLLMAGMFAFYVSKSWKIKIQGRDFGWLVGGAIVLLMEILLYLEWDLQASILLFGVITAYFVLRVAIGYWNNRKVAPERLKLIYALREANWRTFTFLFVINCLAAAAMYSQAVDAVRYIRLYVSAGSGRVGVQEYGGMTLGDLFTYQLWWIPMIVAIYLAIKKRNDYYYFISIWFFIMIAVALLVRRLEIFAAAPAALLAGVGLDQLWGWVGVSLVSVKKVGVVALIILLIVLTTIQGAGLQKSYAMAADTEWLDALGYLRENTPENSVVVSQWSWGYWILDVGQREPFVDNGFYGYDYDRLNDVGRLYITTVDSEAVQIMKTRGIDYIIFSKQDADSSSSIMGWAGITGRTDFPRYSLYSRSMGGNFTSNAGLEVLYRSPKSQRDYVVILGLNHEVTSPDSSQSP